MRFLRVLGYLLILLVVLAAAGAVAGYIMVQRYGADLPDYTQLAKYDPPVVTRVLAGDGRLLAEYAIEKRVFVPIGSIPKRVIAAFLAILELFRREMIHIEQSYAFGDLLLKALSVT